VTVTQQASGCSYSVTPQSQSVAASGGSLKSTVSSQNGCSWAATTDASWVTLTAAAGSGTGDVTFTCAANKSSNPRRATVTVGDARITVDQAGKPKPGAPKSVTIVEVQ
jgi:hypothetical protein